MHEQNIKIFFIKKFHFITRYITINIFSNKNFYLKNMDFSFKKTERDINSSSLLYFVFCTFIFIKTFNLSTLKPLGQTIIRVKHRPLYNLSYKTSQNLLFVLQHPLPRFLYTVVKTSNWNIFKRWSVLVCVVMCSTNFKRDTFFFRFFGYLPFC